MENILPPYFAYLLRFWPEQQGTDQHSWRFALLDSRTGERVGFQSVDDLAVYLRRIVETAEAAGSPVVQGVDVDNTANKLDD